MNKKPDSNRIILCDALSPWLLRSSQNKKHAVSCGLGELIVVYVFYKWEIVGIYEYPKMMIWKWGPVCSTQRTCACGSCKAGATYWCGPEYWARKVHNPLSPQRLGDRDRRIRSLRLTYMRPCLKKEIHKAKTTWSFNGFNSVKKISLKKKKTTLEIYLTPINSYKLYNKGFFFFKKMVNRTEAANSTRKHMEKN